METRIAAIAVAQRFLHLAQLAIDSIPRTLCEEADEVLFGRVLVSALAGDIEHRLELAHMLETEAEAERKRGGLQAQLQRFGFEVGVRG